MRPVILTISGIGSTPWIKTNTKASQFQIGFGCVVTGTTSFTVEHTYDNVDTVAVPTVFPHTTVAAKTASTEGTYVTPVAAFRITTASGTGSVTITSIQAGAGG